MDDDLCYGCGTKNREGFHLFFYRHEDQFLSEVTFRKSHQGYQGVVHGGFLALVLDETMTNLPIYFFQTVVVTLEFQIRYNKMVKVGESMTVVAELVRRQSRKFFLRGEARRSDGTVMAEATATCLKV